MTCRIRKERYFEKSGMPIFVTLSPIQSTEPFHDHEFHELIVVLAGEGVHVTKTARYPIRKGDAFVIHPGDAHAYRTTRGLAIANVLFEADRLIPAESDLCKLAGYHALFTVEPAMRMRHGVRTPLKLSAAELAVVTDLITNMKREIDSRQPAYRAMTAALFVQMAGFLSRCYTRMEDPERHPLARMGTVLSYMEEHFTELVTLEQLARTAHMSRCSLYRAFKRSLGASPIDYLIRLRIQKAAEILLREDMNVTETAFRMGFSDSNYFSRQFRRVMGMSPRSFRKQRQARN